MGSASLEAQSNGGYQMEVIWHQSANPDVYEEARIGRVFNHRRPTRFPLAVVKARHAEDVIGAVKLAIEKKCRVAVRSGGHSWAAWSVRNDSILIDLGMYKYLEVDPRNKLAIVSPSMTGNELNSFLIKEHGLMFPGGHCPDVGLGGFLLQGGMGWNCRNWGWACERVQAIDVITADGRALHCNENQNQDLYWAARGAGPGFPAIVTKFHLHLLPYPERGMRSSAYIYPVEKYEEVFRWIIDLIPTYDQDTEIVMVSQYMEGRDEICLLVLLVTMKFTADEALQALNPAQESRPSGTIEEWFCREDSLENEYRNQAAANPEGHRYCSDNAYINNDADVPKVLKQAFTTLPHRKSFALWYAMNPCSRRTLPEMALSMHSDHYFALYTVWEDKKDDARCMEWVQRIMKSVERQSVGAYLGDSDFQVRRTRYWSEENGKRLMQIRRKWDPLGMICGYLSEDDSSRINELANIHEWKL